MRYFHAKFRLRTISPGQHSQNNRRSLYHPAVPDLEVNRWTRDIPGCAQYRRGEETTHSAIASTAPERRAKTSILMCKIQNVLRKTCTLDDAPDLDTALLFNQFP